MAFQGIRPSIGRALGKGGVAPTPAVDFGDPPRAVLGCIQIATDFVLDTEAPLMMQKLPGVELRMQKLGLVSDKIGPDTYLRSADNIGKAVACMLPPERCTVLGLSCTSMSFALGPEAVDAQLRSSLPIDAPAKTTDMSRAQAAALRALGADRVALCTPYLEDVSQANEKMLEDNAGVSVVSRMTMGLDRDELSSLVTPECIRRWAIATDCADAQAVVIGCSALRACAPGFIDALELDLGKPVVTSTQAFLWSMLRTAGVEDQIDGYGVLLRDH